MPGDTFILLGKDWLLVLVWYVWYEKCFDDDNVLVFSCRRSGAYAVRIQNGEL